MKKHIQILIKQVSIKNHNRYYSELTLKEKLNVLHLVLEMMEEDMLDLKQQSKQDDAINIAAIIIIGIAIMLISFHL